MTKDELITFIKDLEVEEELKSQLLAVVENKTEVTEDMIRTIADIVDLRADLYQDEAEAQIKQSQALDDLISALNKGENEERLAILNLLKKTKTENKQDKQTQSPKEQVEYVGSSTAQTKPAKDQDTKELEKVRQDLQSATK